MRSIAVPALLGMILFACSTTGSSSPSSPGGATPAKRAVLDCRATAGSK